MEVALVLTHACNLACRYCYTGEKKRVRMSADVARRAVEAAFHRADDRLQLTFFGGEPLLEAEHLLALAESARARAAHEGIDLVLQMTTNGTRLTGPLLERLNALNVRIALSIDGNRAAHEAARPFAGGASSYDAVDAALSRLLATGRHFNVIAVVDPANVSHLAASVRELFDRGVPAITLNPNWAATWSDDALDAWRDAYERAASVWLAWRRRGRGVSLQPIEGAVGALRRGRSPSHTCGAGRRSFAVAPSGRIYGCSRSVGEDLGVGALGHIDDWLPQPDAVGPNLRAACGNCASRDRCERHCACACREETSDPATPGPTLCWHQHMLEQVAQRLAVLTAA